MKKVTINNKEYSVRYTLRALFIFEGITKKPFSIETLLDHYIFFYSMLIASNPNGDVPSWDEFIDALDSNPEIFNEMSDLLEEQQKKDKVFNDDEEKKDKGKKK